MTNYNNICFLLGGADREMFRIKDVCEQHKIPYIRKNLDGKYLSRHNAEIHQYQQEITELLSTGKTIYAVELRSEEQLDHKIHKNIHYIDHHGNQAHRPASLLQVLDICGITPTKKDLMIAAIDVGGPKAMLSAGFTIKDVHQEAQNSFLSKMDPLKIQQARKAWRNRRVVGQYTIVRMEHSTCSPLNRLYCNKYQTLIVYSKDGEINVFDNSGLIKELITSFPDCGYYGGDGLNGSDIQSCYWSSNKTVDKKNFERVLHKYLQAST